MKKWQGIFTLISMVSTLLFFLALSNNSLAGWVHRDDFLKTYPWLYDAPIGQGRNTCLVCHEKKGDQLTPYGEHYFATYWYTEEFDFKIIELIDSDEDGYDNITEIREGFNPGDKKIHP